MEGHQPFSFKLQQGTAGPGWAESYRHNQAFFCCGRATLIGLLDKHIQLSGVGDLIAIGRYWARNPCQVFCTN